jgi:hypothetical protein
MKALRISLSLLSFTFGIGGAFATQMLGVEAGYEFVHSNPVGQKCVQRQPCRTEEGDLCTITGTTVPLWGLQPGVDACAKVLYKIPN